MSQSEPPLPPQSSSPPLTSPIPVPSPATPKSEQSLSPQEISDAADKLGHAVMFQHCLCEDLKSLASKMVKQTFQHNDYVVAQNQNMDSFYVLASGQTRRLRVGRDGVERILQDNEPTIGALTVTSGHPIYASARCVSQVCTVYALSREHFRNHVAKTPRFATTIIESLSEQLHIQSREFRTPLLAHRSSDVNFAAVAVASTAESYYRSALNAMLNRQLTGNPGIPLFPSMHVQVPARIAYITGFKALRVMIDRKVDTSQWPESRAPFIRLATTVAPGIIMTPISSILEACNAGPVNPEPLLQRCVRGIFPRTGREVIFGVGLNQLSDYFEERCRAFGLNAIVSNTTGSVLAGVAAGYFSHVPHNISTLRLMQPHRSYSEIFQSLVDKSIPERSVPKFIPLRYTNTFRSVWTCLWPKGVVTRTVQICGSFAILNTLIFLIEIDNRRRMSVALQASSDDEPLQVRE